MKEVIYFVVVGVFGIVIVDGGICDDLGLDGGVF